MDKKSLSETDIRTKFITPAIQAAGWDMLRQVREEVTFTAGRIVVRGRLHTRGTAKRADYVLFHQPNLPLAVIEAKDNKQSVGSGMQQALDYAETLDVPFVFSSNGDGFLFHDRTQTSGQVETELSLIEFPSPAELWARYCLWRGIVNEAQSRIEAPYYDDGSGRTPRYYQVNAINRTVEAVARGQKRVLLVMATGTGKTYTAFQIIWRLWKSGAKKRILFLADRNILIDQTMVNDFRPFKGAMAKLSPNAKGIETVNAQGQVTHRLPSAVQQQGLCFIGPSPRWIRALGHKTQARAFMAGQGMPQAPSSPVLASSDEALVAAARIGYPVLVKPAGGGGGIGMLPARDAQELAAAWAKASGIAAKFFGTAELYLERLIEAPRHIEFQVLGDRHGEVRILFERDCSVQRRHQKVLEEARPVGIPEAQLADMRLLLSGLLARIGYDVIGTVEMLYTPQDGFVFLEMNTRLQVEHPVTEYITGTDLVEWQLRVASGQPLPLRQEQLAIHGHAIEARLYAEDADRGFLPSTGTLRRLRLPIPSAHVRVDTGVEEGDSITPYYDPMIAKLIVWDVDRDAALRRMSQALADCQVVGVTTNAGFLRRLVNTDSFAHAKLDTALIEREQAALSAVGETDDALWQLAAVAAVAGTAGASTDARDPHSPWQAQDGWRLGASAPRVLPLQQGERRHTLKVWTQAGGWRVQCDDAAPMRVTGTADAQGLAVQLGERRWTLQLLRDGDQLYLFGADGQHRFTLHDPVGESDHAVADAGSLLAPMPGRIVATLVAAGTEVKRGTPLVVLEAMKMEHTLQAPADGTVKGYRAKAGDQVGDGAVLVDFEAA